MGEVVKQWADNGTVAIAYTGDGDGSAVITSSENTGPLREVEVSFIDATRAVVVTRVIRQAAAEIVETDTYTRLTYIECTGKQYINTGYVVKEDDIIDMYYIMTSTSCAD